MFSSYLCVKSKLKAQRGHKVVPVMSHKFGFLTPYEVVEISRKINMLKFLLVPAQLLPYIDRLLPLFKDTEMKHLKAEKKTYKRRYNFFVNINTLGFQVQLWTEIITEELKSNFSNVRLIDINK